ncbi:MAG: CapA family protein [Methylohalobius sp.]|nr:CapA family protein [Methylohalobius sp.]
MDRRRFLYAVAGLPVGCFLAARPQVQENAVLTLFLCGDVMTGRGIDQILPHPSRPDLFEPYVRSALAYVALAEEVSGPIPRGVDPTYVWGQALEAMAKVKPDLRIVNLETAVTVSDDAWPGKGIHYRMHPHNVSVLKAFGIDCCALANNHVLDWGRRGLLETLDVLHRAGIATAGAGRDAVEAYKPAVLPVPGKARVLVFACGTEDSGILPAWAAGPTQSGVNLIELSESGLAAVAEQVRAAKRPGDIVVVSVHWGGNWGFAIPSAQRWFAHALIDRAQVDLVHGHSSHHVKGIEVYRGKLILYGCGDFLNDYEGIAGYEAYRGDLGLMYFPALDPQNGRLLSLRLVPTRAKKFQVSYAPEEGVEWLVETLNREGKGLGTWVVHQPDGSLALVWS